MRLLFAGQYNMSLTWWSREEVGLVSTSTSSVFQTMSTIACCRVELAFYFQLEDPLIMFVWSGSIFETKDLPPKCDNTEFSPLFGNASRKSDSLILNYFSLISKLFFPIFLSDLDPEINLNLRSISTKIREHKLTDRLYKTKIFFTNVKLFFLWFFMDMYPVFK